MQFLEYLCDGVYMCFRCHATFDDTAVPMERVYNGEDRHSLNRDSRDRVLSDGTRVCGVCGSTRRKETAKEKSRRSKIILVSKAYKAIKKSLPRLPKQIAKEQSEKYAELAEALGIPSLDYEGLIDLSDDQLNEIIRLCPRYKS